MPQFTRKQLEWLEGIFFENLYEDATHEALLRAQGKRIVIAKIRSLVELCRERSYLMGFLKKIKKAVTKSAKNLFRGGSMWGLVDKYVHKPVTKKLQDMIGIGALKDMAAGQEDSTTTRRGLQAGLHE